MFSYMYILGLQSIKTLEEVRLFKIYIRYCYVFQIAYHTPQKSR
jgi:hypothetical protein